MERFSCFIGLILIFGTVSCQNEIQDDLQELGKKLGENIGEIPGIENFNQSAVPSIEEVQDAIKKKCEKNGGESAYEKLESAKDDLQECIQSNFNFTKIQEELDASRKTGSMDEVFAGYCLKSPLVQQCVKNLTLAIDPCLETEEKSNMKLLLNITESLANFVCYKDGDRIAMFVAEGGFECIQSKKEGLEKCANETLRHRIPSDLSLTNMPLFVIDDEGCDDYAKLQQCAVSVLETCEDNTPANIIDALFKFIRRVTPCKDHPLPASVLGNRRRYTRSIGDQPYDDIRKAYDEVKLKFEPHCLRNGGEKVLTEFKDTLYQVDTCLNNKFQRFREEFNYQKGFPFEYFCKDLRKELRSCLSNLLDKIEACLSASERYIPKFGLELYDAVSKFYCKDDAKSLKKFLQERNECIKKIHESADTCINETKHIRSFATDAIVTKNELCSDLKIMRSCYINTATRVCPYDKIANEFVEEFSDAVYSPCTGCRILITNTLLLAVLLLVSKFF